MAKIDTDLILNSYVELIQSKLNSVKVDTFNLTDRFSDYNMAINMFETKDIDYDILSEVLKYDGEDNSEIISVFDDFRDIDFTNANTAPQFHMFSSLILPILNRYKTKTSEDLEKLKINDDVLLMYKNLSFDNLEEIISNLETNIIFTNEEKIVIMNTVALISTPTGRNIDISKLFEVPDLDKENVDNQEIENSSEKIEEGIDEKEVLLNRYVNLVESAELILKKKANIMFDDEYKIIQSIGASIDEDKQEEFIKLKEVANNLNENYNSIKNSIDNLDSEDKLTNGIVDDFENEIKKYNNIFEQYKNLYLKFSNEIAREKNIRKVKDVKSIKSEETETIIAANNFIKYYEFLKDSYKTGELKEYYEMLKQFVASKTETPESVIKDYLESLKEVAERQGIKDQLFPTDDNNEIDIMPEIVSNDEYGLDSRSLVIFLPDEDGKPIIESNLEDKDLATNRDNLNKIKKSVRSIVNNASQSGYDMSKQKPVEGYGNGWKGIQKGSIITSIKEATISDNVMDSIRATNNLPEGFCYDKLYIIGSTFVFEQTKVGKEWQPIRDALRKNEKRIDSITKLFDSNEPLTRESIEEINGYISTALDTYDSLKEKSEERS